MRGRMFVAEGGVGFAANSKKTNALAERRKSAKHRVRNRTSGNDTAAAQLLGRWTRLSEHLWFSKSMLQC